MRLLPAYAHAFLFAALLLAPAGPLRANILGDDLNSEESDDYVSLPMMRLSVDGGVSQWLMGDDSGLTSAGKKYINDQRTGRDLSVDATCYFLPRGGIGLTWIWFISRTAAENLVFTPGAPAHDLKERLSMTYIGPSFWTRLRAGRYGLVHVGFGAGYLSVLNTWTDNGEAVKVEAKTYGVVTSLGWDYSFLRYLGIGLNGRFIFSNVKEWTRNGEKIRLEDPEDETVWTNVPLYRLELNAGLRIFL